MDKKISIIIFIVFTCGLAIGLSLGYFPNSMAIAILSTVVGLYILATILLFILVKLE